MLFCMMLFFTWLQFKRSDPRKSIIEKGPGCGKSPEENKRGEVHQSLILDIFIWAFLIVTAAIFAPCIMFTASAMPAGDITKMPYRWIPRFLLAELLQGIRETMGVSSISEISSIR